MSEDASADVQGGINISKLPLAYQKIKTALHANQRFFQGGGVKALPFWKSFQGDD